MARKGSFISDYANYTDIFYHRSMEEDKLSILDVCGAYGQKDKKKLDRSEINKSARDNGSRLADQTKTVFGLYRYILSKEHGEGQTFFFWMCVVLTARNTLED